LWLQYGFILDRLIQDRLDAFNLIQLTKIVNVDHPALIPSSMLKDAGFVDAWFALFAENHCFFNDYKINARPNMLLIGFFISFTYGLLMGACHASILSVLYVGNKRYSVSRFWDIIFSIVLWLVFTIIIFSHVLFVYGGPNRNWLVIVIAGFAVLFTFAFIGLSIYIDEIEGKFDHSKQQRSSEDSNPNPAENSAQDGSEF
jgi:hypothetical protein